MLRKNFEDIFAADSRPVSGASYKVKMLYGCDRRSFAKILDTRQRRYVEGYWNFDRNCRSWYRRSNRSTLFAFRLLAKLLAFLIESLSKKIDTVKAALSSNSKCEMIPQHLLHEWNRFGDLM
ncbi:hypothetical protein INT48_004943 [Thamnidium elegans]|uniref:Uncharacterized protein n=1 Tax=Thamnidium elegans TaxID=101142 RepID=A0A8H7VS72_9FUNG|nr:hypothetical protein INT48_004943 [Thamnidium elegans]